VIEPRFAVRHLVHEFQQLLDVCRQAIHYGRKFVPRKNSNNTIYDDGDAAAEENDNNA
jgi:hypothetical protein